MHKMLNYYIEYVGANWIRIGDVWFMRRQT